MWVFIYNTQCCDMIALMREVAAGSPQVFRGANVKLENWRQVTVLKLTIKERT